MLLPDKSCASQRHRALEVQHAVSIAVGSGQQRMKKAMWLTELTTWL